MFYLPQKQCFKVIAQKQRIIKPLILQAIQQIGLIYFFDLLVFMDNYMKLQSKTEQHLNFGAQFKWIFKFKCLYISWVFQRWREWMAIQSQYYFTRAQFCNSFCRNKNYNINSLLLQKRRQSRSKFMMYNFINNFVIQTIIYIILTWIFGWQVILKNEKLNVLFGWDKKNYLQLQKKCSLSLFKLQKISTE
ncbi:unnamed protein product [Paramecium sonneborni]|uniref:Transmembrane protein n=1 Tax=Paramecium sonneborni TaxID=65129 RepID=A0A8S1QLG9_9CILI|nr:unnamed protein product [Paramecium sonneborni]